MNPLLLNVSYLIPEVQRPLTHQHDQYRTPSAWTWSKVWRVWRRNKVLSRFKTDSDSEVDLNLIWTQYSFLRPPSASFSIMKSWSFLSFCLELYALVYQSPEGIPWCLEAMRALWGKRVGLRKQCQALADVFPPAGCWFQIVCLESDETWSQLLLSPPQNPDLGLKWICSGVQLPVLRWTPITQRIRRIQQTNICFWFLWFFRSWRVAVLE